MPIATEGGSHELRQLGAAAAHARLMLKELGVWGDDQTPDRFVRALAELTAGLEDIPRRHLAVRFPPASDEPTLVAVTDLPFVSVCEHHLLPFTGVATIAYLPRKGQEIVGLSKLARLLQGYAARPQVQERLTGQIVDALLEELDPDGAACAVRGVHTCMTLRGARTGGGGMVTTQYRGVLGEDPWRREFAGLLGTDAWRA